MKQSEAQENNPQCPPALAGAHGSADWVKTSQQKPTRADGDCEEMVWSYQELFAENENTCEMESIGWHVRREPWQSVARAFRPEWIPYWAKTNLKRPQPPPSSQALRPGAETKKESNEE